MGGIEQDCKLLYYRSEFCSIQIDTVKATVICAGFSWTVLGPVGHILVTRPLLSLVSVRQYVLSQKQVGIYDY